jgi:tRNA (cmo5U34)-methyltransferase
VEATHHHAEHSTEHEDEHRHEGEHGHERHHEDWTDEEYVGQWLERQGRRPERARHFALIRSLITRRPEDEFRYLNLGAGGGHLDEVLLQAFPGAQATLLDGSLAMLTAARKQLQRFDDRVEYVQADLSTHEWADALSGPFDFAVSTIAIHNLRDPKAIRAIYNETYRLLGHGGAFLNLDYVRPARASLTALGPWMAKDPDAQITRSGGRDMPGTMQEQIGWLNEAGFPCVEVIWKELNTVLFCAIRDHLHMPEGEDDHGHGGGDGHAHAH